LKFFHIR